MYDFSLIDKLSKSCDTKHEESESPENCDEYNVLDLDDLNLVIKKTLMVYNKEVLNVSQINQEVDRLDRKNVKLKEKLKQIDSSMNDIQKFVESNYCETNIKYLSIMENIKSTQLTIETCLENIDEYTEVESNLHKDEYKISVDKINSINKIFTVAKINKHSCPICLKNETSHFALPCGHVYCEECSKKLSVTCFVCRENIFKISPLFFT